MANEQENKLNVLKDHLAKVESEKGQFENHVKGFNKNIKRHDDNFSLGVDEEKKGLIDELSSIITSITEHKDKLSKFKGDIESDKGRFESHLDSLLGKLEEGISNLDDQLQNLSSRQEEEISGVYKQMGDKIGTAFATSGDQSGGKETTIFSIIQAMLIYGMIIVGDPLDATGHYGVSCTGTPDKTTASNASKFWISLPKSWSIWLLRSSKLILDIISPLISLQGFF